MADDAAGLRGLISWFKQVDRQGRGPICAVCGGDIRPCPDPDGLPPCPPWHHTTGGHDHDAAFVVLEELYPHWTDGEVVARVDEMMRQNRERGETS